MHNNAIRSQRYVFDAGGIGLWPLPFRPSGAMCHSRASRNPECFSVPQASRLPPPLPFVGEAVQPTGWPGEGANPPPHGRPESGLGVSFPRKRESRPSGVCPRVLPAQAGIQQRSISLLLFGATSDTRGPPGALGLGTPKKPLRKAAPPHSPFQFG